MLYVEQLLIMVLVMDGWKNMLWRIWEKHGSYVLCMMVGGALHGGSFFYMVAVLSSGPTGRSCSTCGQMGANGAWRECGQLCSTWLDNGGIWDPVWWFCLHGSSTWLVVSSTCWNGG
ncbi:unnamed protein product [Meloidogyne enterolobii]|uniref:Uncharacterized protein n=1 Tax=Meloidogyne enterolobii TaxID=390850 RepID=A0ACB0YJV1_MELEN